MLVASQLVPWIEETGDRHVYLVKSRSTGRKHRVDMEERQACGRCDCADFRYNKNFDCWHIQQVRKYITILKVLETMPVE